MSQEHITLGQLLKVMGYVMSGADAKGYLAEEEVMVDGVVEARRGRKLFGGEEVVFGDGEGVRVVGREG